MHNLVNKFRLELVYPNEKVTLNPESIPSKDLPDIILSLSLLQFADDTLLFLPANLDMVRNLKRILRCFEIIFGLKINYHKSSMIGLRVDSSFLSNASDIMGSKIEKLPIKYLELPLLDKALSANDWNPVVQRVRNKLSFWKGKLLSPMGRLILIKASLSSIRLFYKSLFSMPVLIRKKMEHLLKVF